MKLAELNKLLKLKKRGDIPRNICLDSLSIEMLDNYAKNRSEGVKTAVYAFYHNQFAVIKITNTINHRVYYMVDHAINYYRPEYMMKFLNSSSAIGVDMMEHKSAAFDLQIIGLFKTMVDALDYKDYKINTDLNNGVVLYNNETYTGVTPRVYYLQIDHGMLKSVAKICRRKKLTVNRLILKLLRFYLKKEGK